MLKPILKPTTQTFGQQKLLPGIYCYSVSAGKKCSNGKLIINEKVGLKIKIMYTINAEKGFAKPPDIRGYVYFYGR